MPAFVFTTSPPKEMPQTTFEAKAKQFLLDRYATQAPDPVNKQNLLVKKLRRIGGM